MQSSWSQYDYLPESHACGKKGHIAPAGRSKPKGQSLKQHSSHKGRRFKPRTEKTHQVQTEEADNDSSSDEYLIFNLGETSSKSLEVPVIVNGKRLIMELDTGVVVSIISEKQRKNSSLKRNSIPQTLR